MNKHIYPVTDKVIIFTLDGFSYALPLKNVTKVIHALEIRELPKAPEIISGIINVKGEIFPVVDMRKRFQMKVREIIPEDNFILCDTGKRHIALWIDEVNGIKELSSDNYLETKQTLPYAQFIKGVAKIDEDLILIYDLEQCLNLNEEIELEQALLSNKI